jgi:quinohemoprotein ethanol dehydrogenase
LFKEEYFLDIGGSFLIIKEEIKMKFRRLNLFGPLLVAASLCAAAPLHASDRNITDKDLSDRSNTADWLAYGRTHYEQRFSPVKDINVSNISKLKPAWYKPLPEENSLTSTPLVIDGVYYFTGNVNKVYALDATTGKTLWIFDPKVGEKIREKKQRRVFWIYSRGLAAYGDKIFLATWDGRLIGINRKTGKQVWETRALPRNSALQLTMAPKVGGGKILIGNGGTEAGPTRGWVAAYDAETGREDWRWYIVPGDPRLGFEDPSQEAAAKTWSGKWWEHGGGGNAWHGFSYDPELDQFIFGTGNGSPWNRKVRSPSEDGKGFGDNLYLSSVIALDAQTGAFKWHVQTAPGDTWDYNSNMDITLADLKIDGKMRKVALHAPKNGFFYVIDRETGKVISAEKFAKANWSTKFDLKTQKHVVPDSSFFYNGEKNIFPLVFGAHSWHSQSFNPETGLMYIPTQNLSTTFADKGLKTDASWRNKAWTLGIAVGVTMKEIPGVPKGSLTAYDPIKQKIAWKVDHDFYWGGGTLSTGGNLVFQSEPTGKLKAYDARNGKQVWEYDTGLGLTSAPITYKVGGTQYIAVLVGPGGAFSSNAFGSGKLGFDLWGWKYGVHERRLIAFALDGTAKVPAQEPPAFAKPVIDKNFKIDDDKAAKGAGVYALDFCLLCHGGGAVSGVKAPDLRESEAFMSGNLDTLREIVVKGALTERGMPIFPHLSDDDLKNLRHYIRKQARDGAKNNASH